MAARVETEHCRHEVRGERKSRNPVPAHGETWRCGQRPSNWTVRHSHCYELSCLETKLFVHSQLAQGRGYWGKKQQLWLASCCQATLTLFHTMITMFDWKLIAQAHQQARQTLICLLSFLMSSLQWPCLLRGCKFWKTNKKTKTKKKEKEKRHEQH